MDGVVWIDDKMRVSREDAEAQSRKDRENKAVFSSWRFNVPAGESGSKLKEEKNEFEPGSRAYRLLLSAQDQRWGLRLSCHLLWLHL